MLASNLGIGDQGNRPLFILCGPYVSLVHLVPFVARLPSAGVAQGIAVRPRVSSPLPACNAAEGTLDGRAATWRGLVEEGIFMHVH